MPKFTETFLRKDGLNNQEEQLPDYVSPSEVYKPVSI
jgi:hypothetical protein